MQQPPNPLTATLRWLGYVAHRYEPIALLISGISLTVGGSLIGWSWWVASLPIVVGAALPALALAWSRRITAHDDVVQAREKLLEEALAPLLEFAATVTSRPRAVRRKDAEMAASNASRDLKNAFDAVRGVRVVVFVVSDDGSRLMPSAPSGRQVRPRPLERGTAAGDRAFAILEKLGERFVIEESASTVPSEGTAADAYQTSLTVPIRSTEDGFGLLTIDAPGSGSLDRSHGSTVALFAAALGVLFAEAARGAVSSGYNEADGEEP
ncbi:MAG: hypothetical protein ACRDO7_07785 [Nocardioidaceae bacterium]